MLTAEYGGSGGKPIESGLVVEEPDIEIGAGVSSKGKLPRVEAAASHYQRDANWHSQPSADEWLPTKAAKPVLNRPAEGRRWVHASVERTVTRLWKERSTPSAFPPLFQASAFNSRMGCPSSLQASSYLALRLHNPLRPGTLVKG